MGRQHQPSFYQLWLLLLIALIVFSPVLFKFVRLPGIPGWSWGGGEKSNPAAIVWVAKQTGFYYCHGSPLYGNASPGMSMTQKQALGQGYRPAAGHPCP